MVEECTWGHKTDHQLYYLGRSMMGEHSVNQMHQIFFEDTAKKLHHTSRVIKKTEKSTHPITSIRKWLPVTPCLSRRLTKEINNRENARIILVPQILCHGEKCL
jgi:hypothetical protein